MGRSKSRAGVLNYGFITEKKVKAKGLFNAKTQRTKQAAKI
jgi:hypothetical protein